MAKATCFSFSFVCMFYSDAGMMLPILLYVARDGY